MTPLGWTVALLGTFFGLFLGYFFGRLKLFFVIGTTTYDCSTRTITVPIPDGTSLHRVYGHVMSGAPTITNAPHSAAVSTNYTGGASVTLTNATWPNTGQVSWVVWGATYTNTSGTKNCGSGSGSFQMIKELEGRPTLMITVPDGPLAGACTAQASDSRQWQAKIGNATYTIVCESAESLIVQGPSGTASARTIATGPFSAMFPGAVFQANGDVLVTKG